VNAETVLAEVMTEVAIAELPTEDQPRAILEGLRERGWTVAQLTVNDMLAMLQ
jgi:hypothetical protein